MRLPAEHARQVIGVRVAGQRAALICVVDVRNPVAADDDAEIAVDDLVQLGREVGGVEPFDPGGAVRRHDERERPAVLVPLMRDRARRCRRR